MHISFSEGSYLEIIKFKAASTSKWAKSTGIVDLAVLSDNADISLQQQYLNSLGLSYHGPYGDDKSKSVYPSAKDAGLPFVALYKDRSATVSFAADATAHPNGVTGIKDIQIVCADVPAATEKYKQLLGAEPIENHGQSARFQSGPTLITLTNAWSPALEEQLKAKGDHVYSVHLRTSKPLEAPVVVDGVEYTFASA